MDHHGTHSFIFKWSLLQKRTMFSAEFEKVAADVKKTKTKPTDQESLELYGLYKQALIGDINIDKPGIMDMAGKVKWEAWDSRKGMSKEDSISAYITTAKKMISKYGM